MLPGPRIIILLFLVFGLSACIERYDPDENEFMLGSLVVVANLDNKPGEQHIYLSRSTELALPRREAETGCYVELERSDGELLEFMEKGAGSYSAKLDKAFLHEEMEYRLHIINGRGQRYESGFESLQNSPAIDSIYWYPEDRPTEDPNRILEGLQFYLDFEIEKVEGRYLRWELVETYEIHNPEYSYLEMYDLDRTFKPVPDSLFSRYCWITDTLPDLFTMDMGGVAGELYRGMPLNYVSNEPHQLHHRYSLLVRQLAMSPAAFWYWDGLKKNLQTGGALFDRQPSLTPSNICNVEDDDEVVIGYFSISGLSEKRIFVEETPGLSIKEDPNFCFPGGLPYRFWRLTDKMLPYWIGIMVTDGEGSEHRGGIAKECVDCRAYPESTNIKPDYW